MNTGILTRGAEKTFLTIKNVLGATITKGYAVVLAVAGNSFDGVSAVLADSGTAANLPGFIGIARDDIADNSYGLAQCFGYNASVFLSAEGTSITITQGDCMIPGAGAGGMSSAAAGTYAASGFGYVLAVGTPTISAAVYTEGFIKCL